MRKHEFVTIDKILDLIQSDMHIVVGSAAAEPQELMLNLSKTASRVKHVTVSNCLPVADADFYVDEKFRDSFFLDGWFYTGVLRKTHKHGNISFIPNNLHFAGKKRIDYKKVDIFVTAATMPDEHGFVSLSVSNIYEKEILEQADIVVLEVNDNFPRTYGDMEVHINDVDYLVKTNYEPPTLPNPEPNEKDVIIGNYIANEIHDGDTIQLGIGGIPNAVAKALLNKKDLGIHTEMFTSNMIDLIQAGVVNGKKKTLHRGKHVCCFAFGTKEMYDFIDGNPSILMLQGRYVNDPAIIGLNDNQVSINSTLEIDLTGQCCSESIGTTHFSGTGGQTDTAVGAQNAKNGRSFISLYSTAMVRNKETGEKEEVSKIVCTLKPGAAVSLSRNDVDYVVTEYGIVSLRGKNIRERAKDLISIAHPKFREQLKKEALEVGFLNEHF
ncbi:MAG: acetyl-CoA hydrolase/transferase family protein [Bacilli bacterium]|nr:acetyl-CoA hydrolase/transferase family protein [Bacilli bacterium]MBN2876237.1 acetyl-CoA hydrolase/transferase family protein [Bacilli bacterium]